MKKVAIVTGASRGIGAATALLLAEKGYIVVVNYLDNQEAADRIVQQITESGGKSLAYQADVSIEKQVNQMFLDVNQQIGPATHLVNNVGVLSTQSRLVDISLQRFRNIMQSNVESCFLCSKAFVKQCVNKGAIVNVSSAASRSGAPFEYVDYAASKGAMDTLTKGLSLEVAEQGIRVNAVRPGFIYTDMHADGGEAGRVDRLASQIPLKRGGKAEEVAEAIAWLLSDEASYVTGSFIDIAGGK